MATKHKCFISYHKADEAKVTKFIEQFGADSGVFIKRHNDMGDDIINSTNTDYVMQRVRKLYLADSTVTIVLVGKCTSTRRYVDWEVQSSLRRHSDGPSPNGLVAIQLWESYSTLPSRVSSNVDSGYAKFYKYPKSAASLQNMIQEAFDARTAKPNAITNPNDRYKNNRQC